MADIQLYLEAERRGLLPPDKQALLAEARARGLLGGMDSSPPAGAQPVPTAVPPVGAPMPPAAPPLSHLQEVGHGAAALIDNTVGSIAPMAAQLAYPFVRLGTSPQRAAEITNKLVGAVDKPVGKAFGVTGSPAYQGEASNQLLQGIGSVVQGGADVLSDVTGLAPEDTQNMLAMGAMSVPGMAKAGVAGVKALPPVAKAIAARDAAILAENQANALRADAANKAKQMGIVLNPADSNPTVPNKVKSAIAGHDDISAKAANTNRTKWTELASDEMGIPRGTPLTADAFENARAQVSGPYNAVRNGPPLMPTQNAMTEIRALVPEELIGGKQAVGKATKLIDDALAKVQGVMSGEEAIKNITQLRKDANNIYSSANKPTPKQRAQADASLGIANALETLIEENYAHDPAFVANLRDARKAMAKTYAYEAATDLNTGLVNPQKIAKMTAKDSNLTGTIADIGHVAGNFPDVARTTGITDQLTKPTLVRGGVGGTAGFGLGAAVGMPFAGSVIGATLGATGAGVVRARILSKGGQAAAVPRGPSRLPPPAAGGNALRREVMRAGMIASQNHLEDE